MAIETEYAVDEIFLLVDLLHGEYSTATRGGKLIHTCETFLAKGT